MYSGLTIYDSLFESLLIVALFHYKGTPDVLTSLAEYVDHPVCLAVYRRPGPAAGLLSCNIHGQSLGKTTCNAWFYQYLHNSLHIFFIICSVTYSKNTCRLQVSLDMSLIIPWPCMYTHIIRLRQLRLSIVCCISDQKSLSINYIFCIWIFVCKLDTYIIEYLYLDMI